MIELLRQTPASVSLLVQ